MPILLLTPYNHAHFRPVAPYVWTVLRIWCSCAGTASVRCAETVSRSVRSVVNPLRCASFSSKPRTSGPGPPPPTRAPVAAIRLARVYFSFTRSQLNCPLAITSPATASTTYWLNGDNVLPSNI